MFVREEERKRKKLLWSSSNNNFCYYGSAGKYSSRKEEKEKEEEEEFRFRSNEENENTWIRLRERQRRVGSVRDVEQSRIWEAGADANRKWRDYCASKGRYLRGTRRWVCEASLGDERRIAEIERDAKTTRAI